MEEKLNPWLKIWTSPRQTVRHLLDTNKFYGFKRLCWVYGFVLCLNVARSMFLGASYSIGMILIASIILAFPIGYIAISISTFLFQWTGRWIKGSASYYEVRTAVVWSNVPTILTGVIWLIIMATYGKETFTHDLVARQVSQGHVIFIQITSLLQLVLSIWGLIILLHGLGEAHGFSAWKALLSLIFVMVLWFVLLVLCVLVTYVLMKSSTVAMLIL